MRPWLDRRGGDADSAPVRQPRAVAKQSEAKLFVGRQRGSLVKLMGLVRLLATGRQREWCKLYEALSYRFGERYDPHCRVLVSPHQRETVLGIGDSSCRIVAAPRAVHVDIFGVQVQRCPRLVQRTADV